MSKHTTLGWTLWPSKIATGESVRHQSHSATGWLHTLSFWMDRSRQRSQLRELADLDDDLLRDIGVTREEALREAEKPFWR
jgi:uncharacterized protein YjiS (DUF1127 family)